MILNSALNFVAAAVVGRVQRPLRPRSRAEQPRDREGREEADEAQRGRAVASSYARPLLHCHRPWGRAPCPRFLTGKVSTGRGVLVR